MGLPLSTVYFILFDLLFLFILFDRAASILPSRPHISIAVARSGGQHALLHPIALVSDWSYDVDHCNWK